MGLNLSKFLKYKYQIVYGKYREEAGEKVRNIYILNRNKYKYITRVTRKYLHIIAQENYIIY